MKLRRIILGLLLFQCIICAQCAGECVIFSDPNDYIDDPNVLQNGLFECGDPNLTEYDFTPPIYWERIPHPESSIYSSVPPVPIDCYAALHSSFNPDPNNQNANVNWSIDDPYEGDTFVLLSTGGFDEIEDGEIIGAKISQKVLLNEGDVILGAYFLGTTDYPNYNDYGRIFAQLEPNSFCPDSNDIFPDPNELVINGGFDSDESWELSGLWTIIDPNNPDPNIPDPNLVEPHTAAYNVYFDPNVESTLSQTNIPLVPDVDYWVSIDVLEGDFNSGSDAFTVTLGNETHTMVADANTTITQSFTPTSGDTLTISWGHEGSINIDNVSVRFFGPVLCNPVNEFLIASKKVGTGPDDIPPYGSTVNWVEFEHVVEPNQAGPYVLQCEVVDFDDAILNTYLAVDGLRICRGGKPQSDLNDDCNVNLIDYSILSQAWLAFCPDDSFKDPNLYDPNDWPPITDPNIPCQLADLDNSWFVDPNDLNIMSYEWLDGTDPNNF
jgi:hypothetical protein